MKDEQNKIDGNNLEKGINDSDKRRILRYCKSQTLIDVLEWSTLSGDVIILLFFYTECWKLKTCCWRWWWWRRRWCFLMRINIWKPKYFSSCSRKKKERISFVSFVHSCASCLEPNFSICVFRPTFHFSINMYALYWGIWCGLLPFKRFFFFCWSILRKIKFHFRIHYK